MVPILTDENFEQEIQNADKPVVVDFMASWCSPCFVLGPILEKIAEDLEGKIILIKVDLDNIPLTAQKFGINQIPTVVLFKDGKPISGFIGARPEPFIREWLEKMLGEGKLKEEVEIRDEEKGENGEIEEIIKWYEDYAKKNGFRLNPDRATVERLIKGLLANEKKYGARYCPCRRVTGNQEMDLKNVCPCYYHREELEKRGHCFCGLFIK